MPDYSVRTLPTAEHTVILGEYAKRFWLKEVEKQFKKTIHPWKSVEKSLVIEFAHIENSKLLNPSQYNPLCFSPDGKYIFYKYELRLPGNKRSASGAGYRLGLFVEAGVSVTIICIGHKEHYNQLRKGGETACLDYILKNYYPELHQLTGRKG